MKRLFWIVLLPVALLGGLYFGGVYAYENRLYAPISRMISDETKQKLRDTVLVFQTKAALEQDVADLERRLIQTEAVQELFEVALRNNPNLPEELPFSLVGTEEFDTGRDRFSVTSYETPFVPLDNYGRRAYLEHYQGDLLLVTAKGTVGRGALDEMTGDGFAMPVVRTNLPDLIQNPEFYEVGRLSIKDALVREDQLLLSYTKALTEGCYALAIAAADLAGEALTFEDIFVSQECVRADNEYGTFTANQTGGRMLLTGPETILFSTGEWQVHPLAQDPESFYGKIVELNLTTSEYVVKSLGHRNPQGLYYDADANVIISSEHGALGGDEVNINRSPDGEPENFGWPMASYGEHYGFNEKYYENAPLHKSHAEHGYLEPELHFSPAISPSEILRLTDPRDPDRYAVLMGAMGFDYREGDRSVYVFDLDDEFKITSRERIILDDRVRDMIHLPGTQEYVLFLEGDAYEYGTIALMQYMP